jgi:hypothetical protein
MSEPISFEGQITKDLFVKVQKSILSWKQYIPFIFPIWLVYFALTLKDIPNANNSVIRLIYVLVGVALAIGLHFYQIWNLVKVYRKTPYLKSPIHGNLGDEGLFVKDSNGETNNPWGLYIKYKMSKDFVILYKGPNVFNLLSADFFKSRAEWERACQFITQMMPGSS